MDFQLHFPKPKSYKSSCLRMPCLIEQKIDGWRMMVWGGHAYGRKQDSLGRWINRWSDLPDHLQALATAVPVDGEVYWPGKDATDVATGLKERNKELQFAGFRIANKELYPHEHLFQIKAMGIPTPLILTIGFSKHNDTAYHSLIDKERLKDECLKRGWEGVVLKERYRISSWWKIKLANTYDLIVTGFTWPTAGRNLQNRWIKSLVCSAYVNGELQVIANVGGMTDEVKSQINKNDIGRVVEVKANLLASKGRLKHSRFIRWREDKDAKDCKL